MRGSTSGGWTGSKVSVGLGEQSSSECGLGVELQKWSLSLWASFIAGEDWIKIPLANPTFWLNYIFFTTPYHWKNNTVSPFSTLSIHM